MFVWIQQCTAAHAARAAGIDALHVEAASAGRCALAQQMLSLPHSTLQLTSRLMFTRQEYCPPVIAGTALVAAVRASAAPGDAEALGLAAAVDHRSLLGMLKAVHFRGAAGGDGGDGARFHSRLGREVFMLTCKARSDRPAPARRSFSGMKQHLRHLVGTTALCHDTMFSERS